MITFIWIHYSNACHQLFFIPDMISHQVLIPLAAAGGGGCVWWIGVESGESNPGALGVLMCGHLGRFKGYE